jgi:protein-L-isoaspartate(D-aspartate) O-methyltransferase (PCMT)
MRSTAARVARALLPAPALREIRRRRVHAQIATYRRRVVEHTYAGHPLRIALRDPLAEGWYDHDWGTQPEIDVLRSGRLRPGARVFDLGAHQGVVALMLARIVGPAGHVVAVEAEPHNARGG